MRGWQNSLKDRKIITFRGAAILAVSVVLIRQFLQAAIGSEEIFLSIDDILIIISGGIATICHLLRCMEF